MTSTSLYHPDLWDQFVVKSGKFKPKTYKHFDNAQPFEIYKAKLHKYLSDPTLKSIATHAFFPFIKIKIKTPRYRYQEGEGYGLDTKIRPISFASHFDSLIYSFYAYSLNEHYQNFIKNAGFAECVLAYRTDLKGKCNIQFSKEVFDLIASKKKFGVKLSAIAVDISGYFDSILHDKLKNSWCRVIACPQLPDDQYNLFWSLTRYSYVNKSSIQNHFGLKAKQKASNYLDAMPNSLSGSTLNQKMSYLREKNLITENKPTLSYDYSFSPPHVIRKGQGIPQGSPMSSVLSNIYMLDFDRHMFNLSQILGFTYRRYCDDILIVCNSNDVKFIYEKLIKNIDDNGLKIQDKKKEVINFRMEASGKLRAFNALPKMKRGKKSAASPYKNLQYLGFEFNGENVYIRPGSLSRYFKNAKSRISKTVNMAYSEKSNLQMIFKKKLYERYTDKGKNNFLSYARNAAKESYSNSKGIIQEGFGSKSIKRQLASHFSIIQKEIIKTSAQRKSFKLNREIDKGFKPATSKILK